MNSYTVKQNTLRKLENKWFLFSMRIKLVLFPPKHPKTKYFVFDAYKTEGLQKFIKIVDFDTSKNIVFACFDF